MKVTVFVVDGMPIGGLVPTRATYFVDEAESLEGLHPTPQYRRVLLDNGHGHSMLVPHFIEPGDEIIINTTDDSYITSSNCSSVGRHQVLLKGGHKFESQRRMVLFEFSNKVVPMGSGVTDRGPQLSTMSRRCCEARDAFMVDNASHLGGGFVLARRMTAGLWMQQLELGS